jgi:integrase/recombinase XerD
MSKAVVIRPRKPTVDWDRIIPLWLHGRPESTCDVYRPIVEDFRQFIKSKPIGAITLKDLQDYQDLFVEQKPATVKRKLATIKSLLAFAHKTGMIPFNVGVALRAPKIIDDLAERIITPEEMQRMIHLEPVLRDQILLRVMYISGIRASEASGLHWRDVQPREKSGQITVLGKGGKTRAIRLSKSVWDALQKFGEGAEPHEPVFRTATGEPMTRFHITMVVKRSGRRAGIPINISAHGLRHNHATHAMDNGAPLALIQATLGHADLSVTSRYLHVRPDESSSSYISS